MSIDMSGVQTIVLFRYRIRVYSVGYENYGPFKRHSAHFQVVGIFFTDYQNLCSPILKSNISLV